MGLHAVHTDRSIVSVPDREKGLYHLLRIHFVIEYSTTTVRPITKLIKVEYKRGDRWVGMAYVAGGYGQVLKVVVRQTRSWNVGKQAEDGQWTEVK